MRRALIVSLAVCASLSLAMPAGALTRVPFEGAARAYEITDACAFPIVAQERSTHPGFLTYDDTDTIVAVRFHGAFDTVLSSSLGEAAYESIGSTTVTTNGDGTWTQVQRGTGLAVVPRDDPEGPKLVWFSGTVTSVGDFDPKSLLFTPRWQTRQGITANVCEQLVSGLKSRHD